MRRDYVSKTILVLVVCSGLVGCTATIKGNLVNASGAAMTGVRLAAQAAQPEASQPAPTVSKKEGKFRLTGLSPQTEYAVLPQLADWQKSPLWSVRLQSDDELNLFDRNGWYKDNRFTLKATDGSLNLNQPLVIEPVFCGLDGVAVDAKKKAMEAVTLQATQIDPIEGYEKKERTTSSQGKFGFGDLFPDSEYVILPVPQDVTDYPAWTARLGAEAQPVLFDKEGWRGEERIIVKTGANRQRATLEAPLVLQPHVSSLAGIVQIPDRGAVADVTVIAQLVEPVPGYEVFQVSTQANGVFLFPHLLPNAEYELYVGEVAAENLLLRVSQPDPLERNELSVPLVPGFRCGTDGVVTDLGTGLQWAPSPDQEISWKEAGSYAEGLEVGGWDDWRLATLDELRSLYRRGVGGSFAIHPALRLTGCCVWSSEESRCLMFTTGFATTDKPENRFNNRVLAVRSGQ